MVNDPVTDAAAAERALALGYAPLASREGLAALFALDARLGQVVRTTREPLVGQMRLAWWRDALIALDTAPTPAEPVLRALAAATVSDGVRGADLATLADGWERLFAEPSDRDAMAAFARARGGTLFALAARLLGGDPGDVQVAGEAWALVELAGGLGNPVDAAAALALARDRVAAMVPRRWPRRLRPLGALSLLARDDLAGGTPGSPRRVGRLLVHRLTGL